MYTFSTVCYDKINESNVKNILSKDINFNIISLFLLFKVVLYHIINRKRKKKSNHIN